MKIISRQEARSQGLLRYYTGVPCKWNHDTERAVSSGSCLECKRLANNPGGQRRQRVSADVAKERRKLATRKKRARQKELIANAVNKWEVLDPRKEMLRQAEKRARMLGRDFNIDIEDIICPTHCPLSGVELDYHSGQRADNAASLDRVDNSRGYVKGNVRVISLRENMLKRDRSVAEIVRLYKYVMGII